MKKFDFGSVVGGGVTSEQANALVAELNETHTTLARLVELNYVLSLFDDAVLDTLTAQLTAYSAKAKAKNTADVDMSILKANFGFELSGLTTGLVLGDYSLILHPDKYSRTVNEDCKIEFVKMVKGSKPPRLGSVDCQLSGKSIEYNQDALARLVLVCGYLINVKERLGIYTCAPDLTSDEVHEIYAKCVASSDAGEAVELLSPYAAAPAPWVMELVKERLTAYMADRSDVRNVRDYYGKPLREMYDPYNVAGIASASGLSTAGGLNHRTAYARANVAHVSTRISLAAAPGSKRSPRDLFVLNALGLPAQEIFDEFSTAWGAIRQQVSVDDYAIYYDGWCGTYAEAFFRRELGIENTHASRSALGRAASTLMKVHNVREEGDYRVALVEYSDRRGNYSGAFVLTVHNTQPLWTALDTGNLILTTGLVIEGGLQWNSAAAEAFENNVMGLGNGRLTPDWFRRNILPEVRRQQLTLDPRRAQQLKVERLQAKFHEVVAGTRDSVKAQDITFTKDSMSFQDVTLRTDPEVFATWLNVLNPLSLENVEFNDILASCLYTCLGLGDDGTPAWDSTLVRKFREYHQTNPAPAEETMDVTLHFSGVEARVRYDETARGHARITVNGYRINKNEVVPVLLRSMCFADTAQYNKFCERVSKCSLRITDYLSNGIEFQVNLGLGGVISTGLLHLRRVKGKNYIVINTEKTDENPNGEELVRVAGINDLISLVNVTVSRAGYSRYEGWGRTSSNIGTVQAKLRKAAPELQPQQLRTLLQTSLKTWLEAVKRSEALLKKTMERFKVTEVVNPFGNAGTAGTFYKVPGQSGNTYYVQKDSALPIFDSRGSRICIVDKGNNMSETVGRDRLVARIYAVALDSQTVQDIGTLRAYVH